MRKRQSSFHRPSFMAGIVCTSLIFILTLAAAATYLSVEGVTLYLDSNQIAALVRDRVVEQAKTDLPNLIAEAKSEIPEIVAKEMKDQLSSDRMEIAGFVFRMPEELMTELRRRLQTNVENATAEILDGMNTSMLAEQFGNNAYDMVRDTIQGEFGGQSFNVMIFERIPLRVKIAISGE